MARLIQLALLALVFSGLSPLQMSAIANDSKNFRTCRTALILAKNHPNATSLPRGFLATLSRQTEFVMAENAFSAPPDGIQAGIDRIRESEAWFLSFSREVAATKSRLSTREALDETLIACQSQIWQEVEVVIERLIEFRQEAWMKAQPKKEEEPEPTFLIPKLPK